MCAHKEHLEGSKCYVNQWNIQEIFISILMKKVGKIFLIGADAKWIKNDVLWTFIGLSDSVAIIAGLWLC